MIFWGIDLGWAVDSRRTPGRSEEGQRDSQGQSNHHGNGQAQDAIRGVEDKQEISHYKRAGSRGRRETDRDKRRELTTVEIQEHKPQAPRTTERGDAAIIMPYALYIHSKAYIPPHSI